VTLSDVPSFFRSKPEGAPVIARRYHFSLAGLAYALTTAVLVIGAINGQNNLLFWLFGLAVAGLVISGILSGWSLMGIRVTREMLTPKVHAGEDVRIRYRITNRNLVFPAFALTIEEMPDARSWFGKKFPASFAAFMQTPVTYVGYVGPRRTVVVEATTRATARGEATFNGVRVASTFPIGLTRKSVTFAKLASMTIWPAKFSLAKTLTREGVEGRATQRLRPSATGDEFFALREFQPGDSIRSVAWRASARADRPLVRSKAVRPGQRVWIVLDDREADDRATGDRASNEQTTGNRPTSNDIERSIAFAASLANDFMNAGSDVGIATVSRGSLIVPAAGDRHRVRLLDALAGLTPGEQSASPIRTYVGERSFFIHAGDAAPAAFSRARAVDVRVATNYDPALLPMLPSDDGADA
jgi:uncharacterized protein (DUF58 family)